MWNQVKKITHPRTNAWTGVKGKSFLHIYACAAEAGRVAKKNVQTFNAACAATLSNRDMGAEFC